MSAQAIPHFADRLTHAIEGASAPICVGLDPVLERLPQAVRAKSSTPAGAISVFCQGVLEAVRGVAPVVKLQSACFERYGADGVKALTETMATASGLGFITILDAKRGDIGISAAHYAEYAFGQMGADALTVNAYLGLDTLDPYLEWSDTSARGRGLFVLVRTSNPGSDAVQRERLEDGRSIAELMADLIAGLGEGRVGECGYSSVGSVVAATKPEDAQAMRKRMQSQIFLVPGYGAQGGDVESVRELFRAGGAGAIVTASRSIIYAFESADDNWQRSVHDAAQQFAQDLSQLTRS